MIGPSADAVEPQVKKLELPIAKLAIEFLQQENGGNLFFEHRAIEKVIGNLDKKTEPTFFSQLPSKAHSSAP